MSYSGLNISTTEGTAGTTVLSGNNTLMMIPQEFTSDDDASIIISFTYSGSTMTLTHKLDGTIWEVGKSIVYSITTSDLGNFEYTLELSGGGITYIGGNISCGICSYRTKTTTGEKQNVEWNVVGYSTDGGSTWAETEPNWLTLASTNGSGSVSATNVNATVSASPVVTTERALSTATPKGNSTDYFDLSKYNVRGEETEQNTANCYVVNAPGYYKFPTVYGNAIKNGEINTSAYHTTNSGSNILSNFVDHNNTSVYTPSATDPYINRRYTPDNAVIVWQDVNGMVSNLSYDSEEGYVKFCITADKIAQGNAIIALRAGTTILWSWHIWATPKDVANTISVTSSDTNYTYGMMSINLGWCATTNTSSYAHRYALIKIRQAKSGKTGVIRINQYSDSGLSTSGKLPFYQGGRKDPMLPGGSADMTDKSYWGNYTWTRTSFGTKATIGQSIQNPHIMYLTSDGPWWSTTYFNLWDMSQNTAPYTSGTSVKTIYDPCPPGYKVPPSYAFTGFSTSNGTYNSGWYFNINNNTIYFPITGIRDCYSPRSSSTGQGKYWISASHNQVRSAHFANNGSRQEYYTLFLQPTSVSSLWLTAGAAYGMPLRPVAE